MRQLRRWRPYSPVAPREHAIRALDHDTVVTGRCLCARRSRQLQRQDSVRKTAARLASRQARRASAATSAPLALDAPAPPGDVRMSPQD